MTFGNILGVHTQQKLISDFLTIPLENLIVNGELYVSQYPTTLWAQTGEAADAASSVTWGNQTGTMTGPVVGRTSTTVGISHMKSRGVYNIYPTP